MVVIIIVIIREWIHVLLVIALTKCPPQASIDTMHLCTTYQADCNVEKH